MTNVTSDLVVTSVGPIPTSGEEEVTSSSTTPNPTDSPANDEPSNDGEAQPDPKPENEDTVADEKGKTFPIYLLAFLIAQFSGILSNRNSETLHFDAKSLHYNQEDQITRVACLALVQSSFPGSTFTPPFISDQEAQPSVAPGPDHERHFDGWSFFGGILLTVSMLLIGFVLTKYYRVKQGEGRIYNRF